MYAPFWVCVCGWTCVCVHVCMFVCVYVCICLRACMYNMHTLTKEPVGGVLNILLSKSTDAQKEYLSYFRRLFLDFNTLSFCCIQYDSTLLHDKQVYISCITHKAREIYLFLWFQCLSIMNFLLDSSFIRVIDKHARI